MAWSHRKNAGYSDPQKDDVWKAVMQQGAEEDQKRDGWMTCLRT
jgi:ABC-type sugar transport system substrate-binding protein